MRSGVVLAIGVALLAGCGPGSVKTEKKAEAPAEPVTGLHALFQMLAASRAWAADSQVYQLTSIHLTDVKAEPGKAGAWQVVFVSPSLQQSRSYTFSVKEVSISLHKGIDSTKPESWSGPRGTTRPFNISAAKKDSDEAYAVALKKAAEYDSKNPGMTISYQLAQTGGYSNAAWRVIWGESAGTSSFSVRVDATNGVYVETLH